MEKKETKLVEALRKDYKQLYVKEYTTRWREERFIRNIELGIMSLKNSEEYISKELDKARGEELEWILKNCSGGGNWRRIVNQRLSKLKGEK